jgi:hypothetical protein
MNKRIQNLIVIISIKKIKIAAIVSSIVGIILFLKRKKTKNLTYSTNIYEQVDGIFLYIFNNNINKIQDYIKNKKEINLKVTFKILINSLACKYFNFIFRM